MAARSPVFTQVHSALSGLTTLRAHRCQTYFQKDFDNYQDVHSSAWFLYMASGRWFGVFADFMVVTYIACVTYVCVALRESIEYIKEYLK